MRLDISGTEKAFPLDGGRLDGGASSRKTRNLMLVVATSAIPPA